MMRAPFPLLLVASKRELKGRSMQRLSEVNARAVVRRRWAMDSPVEMWTPRCFILESAT
jgi:hypothetical protein